MQNRYLNENEEFLSPFLEGIMTKQPKIILLCINAIQKFITNQLIIEQCENRLIEALWDCLDIPNIEELKILQTVILILTTNYIIKDLILAKAFAICLRLHSSKAKAVTNTAAASTRQAASAVFDKALVALKLDQQSPTSKEPPELPCQEAILHSFAIKDAFLLFQDICLLANGEPPVWLSGIHNMSILLAIDIIDYILVHYSIFFVKLDNFKKLLKERVCPLSIRLLSAHGKESESNQSLDCELHSDVSFPVTVRNYHLLLTVITNFYSLLETECEIFLTNLAKQIDIDKIPWKCALALEVINRIIQQPNFIWFVPHINVLI
ncbi:Endocytosis and vacuole integrity protein [Cichlidogyrus casuarinus]|uniref:Endocytosis and vacuole integrity protein n=1 Tax=Cichlidogyrus casuarinus TaxID=1844966 RepID=A0ABD2QLD7_9PLAT